MSDAVETMVSVREVPWHGLGTVVDDKLTAKDALRAAGLNWTVAKVPMYVGGKEGDLPEDDAEGTIPVVRVPDKFGMQRSKDHQILGVVGADYTPLQNAEAFDFMDALVDSGEAKYETAGALRGGRWVWVMMTTPRGIKINGSDEVNLYLLLFNSHDGSRSITAAATPVRVVCQNTLNLGLQAARRRWSVRHVAGGMDGRLDEARRSLGLSFEYFDEFERIAERLAAEEFSQAKYEKLVQRLTDVNPQREGLLVAYETSQAVGGGIRETKWGALNLVGEYYDHLRGPRTPHAQLMGSWVGLGVRQRDRALDLLTS
jgi:phage/plasmid-like protein (TIGR03299 family)